MTRAELLRSEYIDTIPYCELQDTAMTFYSCFLYTSLDKSFRIGTESRVSEWHRYTALM